MIAETTKSAKLNIMSKSEGFMVIDRREKNVVFRAVNFDG